jgi:hypothetical protein
LAVFHLTQWVIVLQHGEFGRHVLARFERCRRIELIGSVAASEDPVGVDGSRDRFAGTVDAPSVRDRDDWVQERFARNACPVRTFATDQFVFSHGDRQARGPGTIGDILADGSGADDDDVVKPFPAN